MDEFTYTITDNQGGVATAKVRGIVVANSVVVPPQPPVIPAARYAAIITPRRDRAPGYVRINVASGGAFTGQVRMGSKLTSFQGAFGTDRSVSLNVNFPGLGAATVKLAMSADGSSLEGSVELSDGTSVFYARRMLGISFLKGKPAPRYTVLLLPSSNSAIPQRGTGYALVCFGKSGTSILTGHTADGNAFSASTAMQSDGSLPIYAARYSAAGVGLLYGELRFASETDTSRCSGDLRWRALGAAGSTEVSIGLTGAAYDPSQAGLRDFRAAELAAEVEFEGAPVSNVVRISGTGTIKPHNESPSSLQLRFNQATGAFTGRVTDPSTGIRLPVRGAVLQSLRRGAGFAGDANVSLEPQ